MIRSRKAAREFEAPLLTLVERWGHQMLSRARFAGGVLSTAASIGIIPRPARAAQYTLKLASPTPNGHATCVRARQIAQLIREETNGRVELQVYGDAALGSASAMFTQLRANVLQFQLIECTTLEDVVPVASIQGIGCAFENSRGGLAAADGELGRFVHQEILASGFYAFPHVLANGMREFTSSRGSIRSVDDFASVGG